MTSARVPTADGEFQLCLYHGSDDAKEHLALVLGDVGGCDGVLVRIHSECFTGDVLGSQRCDCGDQLARSTRLIAEEGIGVLVYLRQEGRGIGLLDKLRAYNLQDEGYDTLDANLALGHQIDEREYDAAADILRDLRVRSLRVLTNNPSKIESLARLGFPDSERVPLETPVHVENATYLKTKARRMRHLLSLGASELSSRGPLQATGGSTAAAEIASLSLPPVATDGSRPSVTLTYAQSLDGSITVRRGQTMNLSCPEALTLTHRLRSRHDAILVGIETVLADDPRLTVRRVEGPNPRPVVLDSRLRTPLGARLFEADARRPWIVTTLGVDVKRQERLEAAGARVIRVPANAAGQVDLAALMPQFVEMGIASLMVEGGARVITSFLAAELVDRLVLTIAPVLIGGLNAVDNLAQHVTDLHGHSFPKLHDPQYQWLGNNLVLCGELRPRRD